MIWAIFWVENEYTCNLQVPAKNVFMLLSSIFFLLDRFVLTYMQTVWTLYANSMEADLSCHLTIQMVSC